MVTPGAKHWNISRAERPLLTSEHSTLYKRIVAARYTFLYHQDSMDMQYTTTEIMKASAHPRESDMDNIQWLARYLLGRPRYVMRFCF